MLINKKLQNLQCYTTENSNDFIKLDANESFVNLPIEKIEKLSKALEKIEFNRYPDMFATESINAFSSFYNLSPSMVTAGNGSDELISVIINGFCEKTDTVLVFTPDFSMYSFYSYIAEVNCTQMPKQIDFKIDVEKVIKKIKETNPRITIFSNPCNPTGIEIAREDIINIANSTKNIVVIDEAYMDFSDQSIINGISKLENVIILKTVSKAFGLAALRLGFAIAGEKITKKLRAVKSPYNINSLTNTFGGIILSDKNYLNNCIEQIKQSRDYLYNELVKLDLKVLPTTTNFIVIVSEKADEIYNYLLDKKILVRKFEGFLRITTASKQENNELINSLKDWKIL